MKRSLSIALSALMTMGMLTACVPASDGPADTTTAAAVTESSEENATEESANESATETTQEPRAYLDVVETLCNDFGYTAFYNDDNFNYDPKTIDVDNADEHTVATATAYYSVQGTGTSLLITAYDEPGENNLTNDINLVIPHEQNYDKYEIGDNYFIYSRLMGADNFADKQDRWMFYGFYNLGDCYVKVIIETHATFDASSDWYREVDGIMTGLEFKNPMTLSDEYGKLF